MTNFLKNRISRRHALTALGVGGGALAAGDILLTPPAHADGVDPNTLPLLVFFRFAGGWDTLLGLDPRDHTQNQFSELDSKIHTGYNFVADEDDEAEALMASTGNTGIITPSGSNISFGMAMAKMAPLYEDLCVIRGIDMGTLSHSVGQRYFLTGKFPRGLSASGSSLSTFWASENAGLFTIPNLVIRTEMYNEGLDPRASGLRIDGYQDLSTVLKPLNPELEPKAELAKALADLQYGDRCLARQLDVTTHVTAHRASFEKSIAFSGGTIWQYFNFKRNPAPGSSVAKVYDAFGINPGNPFGQLGEGEGRAAIAAQAITNGLSQAVSVAVAGGLDTHGDEWAADQVSRQRRGWNAVADFISYMKNTLDPNGKPYWDRMTIVVSSDFARTPRLNTRNGRDHFLYSASLIAGNGIKGNQVVGASSDYDYHATPIDHVTGKPDDLGVFVRPPDVHATLLEAAGLSYKQISNQSPVLLQSVLKA